MKRKKYILTKELSVLPYKKVLLSYCAYQYCFVQLCYMAEGILGGFL